MLKFAARQLLKNPGFTVVALLTLALGIGVNTTAFAVLNRLLLQSLPFREPGRLVQIWGTVPQWKMMPQSPGDYFDERDGTTVFEHVAAYNPSGMTSLAEPNQPALRCTTIYVTANFFPLLGVNTMLGRTFTTEEEEKLETPVVLSDAFWRSHYAADPKILGRVVRLDAKPRTIVGVMPPALNDPMLFNGVPAFWALDGTSVNRTLRSGTWYQVAARLKSGVTIQQAQAELDVVAARLAKDFPQTNATRGFNVVPYPTNGIGDTGTQLTWLVVGLSGMVLLIACVNLANLQLVRTTRRSHELGIRLALGCPRSQLIGMLLTESLLLSIVGGALGLLVARWSNSYIESFFNFEMPLDRRVLGFTLLVSVLTGAIFGVVPAWIASRTDVNASLSSSTRGSTSDRSRRWLRQGLVIAELAIALVLLAGAGFFVRGIYHLTHRDLGWRGDHLVVGYLALDHDHYGEMKDPRSLTFSDTLRRELQAIPGVDAVGIAANSPVWGMNGEPFLAEGQPPPAPGKETYASVEHPSPGFIPAYGLRIVQGRDFNDTDRPGSPSVAIVNESLARKFWPGENPLGKRVGSPDPAHPNWAEVVGVVSDFRASSDLLDAGEHFTILRPWSQNSHRFMSMSVHTALDPQALKNDIRKVVGRLQPDIAVNQLSTAPELMASQLSVFALVRRLLLQISGLGLLLAAVGIYGVIANLASERTKEIGIRMALGAEAGAILWLFLRNGLLLAVIGAVLGLAGSFGLLTFLTKMLPFIPGNTPWVAVSVAFVLVAVAILACWLPARRATRVSPTVALRAE